MSIRNGSNRAKRRKGVVSASSAPAAAGRRRGSKFVVVALVVALVALTGGVVWHLSGSRSGAELPAGSAPAVVAAAPGAATLGGAPVVSAAARPIRDDGSITLDQRDWRSVDDASRDGWGSEVVQGELAKALRQIGADLQQRASGAVPTTDWAALVDAQVSGTALSGAALSAIARVVDESRPSNPAQRLQTFIEVPAPRAAGLEGWIAALDATAAQLRQVGDVAESHVAWKIDGLRVDGDGVEAMVRLFASSHGDAGGVDITSRLRSRWRRGSDGGWRLHELHADQSSLALRRGGAWLSDQTAPWLAQTPLPAELALDVDDVLQRLAKAVPADPIGHAGLAVADVNGDERDDLYVAASPGLPNRLLLGVDGGGFLDVSAASGIDYLDETRAALLLDFDGDGDRDPRRRDGRWFGAGPKRHRRWPDAALCAAAADARGQWPWHRRPQPVGR